MELRYPLCALLLALGPTTLAAQSLNQQGYEDGLNGLERRYLSSSDIAQYTRGYNQGLTEYCQIDNAVRLGKDGVTYQGICDNNSEAFKAAYDKAFEHYQQEQWLALGNRNWY